MAENTVFLRDALWPRKSQGGAAESPTGTLFTESPSTPAPPFKVTLPALPGGPRLLIALWDFVLGSRSHLGRTSCGMAELSQLCWVA